jgi:hypothetical protein
MQRAGAGGDVLHNADTNHGDRKHIPVDGGTRTEVKIWLRHRRS